VKLEARNVSVRFGDKQVLSSAGLIVNPGDFIVISGASGCGKSTLLRLFNELDAPTAGEIVVDDRPASTVDVTTLRRRIVYVQQQPVMIEGTVAENLRLPFRFAAAHSSGPDDTELRRRLDELKMNDVELDDAALPLSVGQQQRLAFLRALLVSPEVLLCDEPTASLDPESTTIVHDILRDQAANGTSIVVVSHDPIRDAPASARHVKIKDGVIAEAPVLDEPMAR
jgi:putative ABC transport system ATP-binding protein